MARVTPPRKKGRVFGQLGRPKLLRKRIPTGEIASGLAVLAFLALAASWVVTRRDAYDPSERDLDVALLGTASSGRELYEKPLQRWRDPSAPVAAAPADLGPFPAILVGGGWRAASRVQEYTPDTLYEKINGQAEQYLKFGFRRLDVLTIERPADGLSIDLYLYDQGSFPNAMGLYAEQRAGKPVERREGLLYTPTSLGATGTFGHHVFHAIGSAPSPAVLEKVDELLHVLAARSAETARPEAFEVLTDRLGLPLEAVSYTPVNAFRLEFAEDFWFGQPEPDRPAKVFVHQAASPTQARALRERLHAAQLGELEVVEESGERSLYRHRYLKTTYALAARGAFVYGVEDHADREGAERLLRALGDAVVPAAPEAEETARYEDGEEAP